MDLESTQEQEEVSQGTVESLYSFLGPIEGWKSYQSIASIKKGESQSSKRLLQSQINIISPPKLAIDRDNKYRRSMDPDGQFAMICRGKHIGIIAPITQRDACLSLIQLQDVAGSKQYVRVDNENVCAFSSISELVVALNNEYDATLEDGLESSDMPLVKYNPDMFEVQLWEGASRSECGETFLTTLHLGNMMNILQFQKRSRRGKGDIRLMSSRQRAVSFNENTEMEIS